MTGKVEVIPVVLGTILKRIHAIRFDNVSDTHSTDVGTFYKLVSEVICDRISL